MRQLTDGNAEVVLAQTYEPYGEVLTSAGEGESSYAYAGEWTDTTGLQYLRARYMNPAVGRFLTRDTWSGNFSNPLSLNKWVYVESNPINLVDPSGKNSKNISCAWDDCEAEKNVQALKEVFIASAIRHNRIPNMDDNGFAALIASILVSERRIGRIPEDRNRALQFLEDLLPSLGCVVSGHYINDAWDNQEWGLLIKYLTNNEIPQYATVGLGNIALWKAEDIWKNQACDFWGNCVEVNVSPLKINNIFNQEVNIANPFDTQIAPASLPGGYLLEYEPSLLQSYQIMANQLLNDKKNIEYVAANLEVGALRLFSLGLQPTAYNSATWHLMSVQTPEEISRRKWDPGAAVWILNEIPTVLTVLGLDSSWNISQEMQYIQDGQEAFWGTGGN